MGMVEHLRRTLPRVFDDSPVQFAYLYGSHALGQSGPRSDIDIAAYFDPHDETTLDVALRLPSALEQAAGRRPIDTLLILNEAPIAITGRVVQEGKIIYSRDEQRRVRHASLTLRMFHDFKIHESRSTRERLQRMATGG